MKLLPLLCSLLLTVTTIAQDSPSSTQPFIEVNGYAEMEVIPNEIFININIHERYINRVKITVEEQEEKLKEMLSRIQIDIKNLSLSDANSDFVRVNWKTNEVLTKKEYVLKVVSAKEVAQVFQELEKMEIKDAYVSKVTHSDLEVFKKQVQINAIKAAKEKADFLLGAIGAETGKPLIVKDAPEKAIVTQRPMRIASVDKEVITRSDAMGFDDSKIRLSDAIEFQKIKLQSSIYVKFGIK